MAAPRRPPRWSLFVGRIAGIEIRLHFTFLLFLGWIAMSHILAGQGWPAALSGVLLLVAVFAIILVHELAHALVARRFGVRTQEILLLPIGGVGRVERIPERPWQELAIAVAGPLVNVVLALVFWAVLAVRGMPLGPLASDAGLSFLARLFWLNVVLAVFNLLPAFPMDGGRVLRAALALKMDRARATSLAAAFGKIFAVVFALLGLFANPMLLFIAVFVWIGAAAENASVQLNAALVGVPVTRIMLSQFDALSPGDTLVIAAQRAMAGFQREFPVVVGDRPVGVLSRTRLTRGLARYGPEAPVDLVMSHEPRFVRLGETAEQIPPGPEDEPVLVIDGARLVGLILPEHLDELSSLRQRTPPPPPRRVGHLQPV